MVLLAAVMMPLSPMSAMQTAPAEKFDCVRSVPTPIIKKTVFPKTSFRLEKIDELGQAIATGTETVQFNNGDRLTITNTGCEYFTLRFRFETSRVARQQISNTQYLYRRSAWLMRQTLPGIHLNLTRGITALEKYAAQSSKPDLDQEIDYGGQEIRSVVKLVEVKSLPNRKVAVEILFYSGPL
jgi:hypothetical protein